MFCSIECRLIFFFCMFVLFKNMDIWEFLLIVWLCRIFREKFRIKVCYNNFKYVKYYDKN